ncbi:MAG: DNA topoisomerase III [Burkholderiales bacterium]|jgi:DNA topoisomerase-3|nr:DNA topoisomerase III [Burkholderiales bacterium]
MRLFLCEKPSQGRDIAKVLGASKRGDGYLTGDGWTVTWAVGHLLEQAAPDAYDPAYKSWKLEHLPILPESWKMGVKGTSADQFKAVKGLLKQAKELVIATDADREGEMIAREVLEHCGYRGPVKRLWLSALNEASVKKALMALKDGKETFPLYHSALARSRADWLVGMNLSRLFTLLAKQSGYDGVVSIGRVQTPTLKLVVDRERAVREFVPVPYWTVDVSLECGGISESAHRGFKAFFKAAWQVPDDQADEHGRCASQALAEHAAKACRSSPSAKVVSVETKRVKQSPPLPFELSELQKVCSAQFGFGAQETLDIAQSLYEKHKATSYPRTDCGYLPESMFSDVSKIVQAVLKTDPSNTQLKQCVGGLDLRLKSRAWNEEKVSEAAHHGIIPTDECADISAMSENERLLYQSIRSRFLAQFAPAHEYDQTEAILICGGQELKAAGRKIVVKGWKDVVSVDDEEPAAERSQELPELRKDMSCAVNDVTVNAQKTSPPALFTEGTLIEAMKSVAKLVTDPRLKQKLKETTGIGTNATRAGIIKGLIDRGFVVKKGRSLVASDAARALIGMVPPAISDPGTTAIWEHALDSIESGQLTLEGFVEKQGIWITGMVEKYRGAAATIKLPPAADVPACPLCKSPMRRRTGANGAFWSCSRYPDCKGVQNDGKGAGGAKKPRKRVVRKAAN